MIFDNMMEAGTGGTLDSLGMMDRSDCRAPLAYQVARPPAKQTPQCPPILPIHPRLLLPPHPNPLNPPSSPPRTPQSNPSKLRQQRPIPRSPPPPPAYRSHSRKSFRKKLERRWSWMWMDGPRIRRWWFGNSAVNRGRRGGGESSWLNPSLALRRHSNYLNIARFVCTDRGCTGPPPPPNPNSPCSPRS